MKHLHVTWWNTSMIHHEFMLVTFSRSIHELWLMSGHYRPPPHRSTWNPHNFPESNKVTHHPSVLLRQSLGHSLFRHSPDNTACYPAPWYCITAFSQYTHTNVLNTMGNQRKKSPQKKRTCATKRAQKITNHPYLRAPPRRATPCQNQSLQPH